MPYIGRGIIFPFRLDSNGRIVITEDENLIVASIKSILSWPKYTKYFDMLFGSRIFDLTGEPNDRVLKSLVYEYTKEAISIYEPRVELLDCSLEYPTASTINLKLVYRIKASNIVSSINYPLYIS